MSLAEAKAVAGPETKQEQYQEAKREAYNPDYNDARVSQ